MDRMNTFYLAEALLYDGITAIENMIWLISTGKNLLIGMNRFSGEIVSCLPIPSKYDTLIPYRFLAHYENKIVLLPYEERAVSIYDISSDTFERIEIKKSFFENEEFCRFTGCEIVNEKIYMYGIFSKVLIFDMSAKEMDEIDLKEIVPDGCLIDSWMWEGANYSDGKIYFVPQTFPCVITLDCNSRQMAFEKMEAENAQCLDNIRLFDHKVYYSPRNGKEQMNCYDLLTKENHIIYTGKNRDMDYRAFGYTAIMDKRLYLLFSQRDEGMVIDLANHEEIRPEQLCGTNCKRPGTEYPYEFVYRNACITEDKHIVAINPWTLEVVSIDTGTTKATRMAVKESKDTDRNHRLNQIISDAADGIVREWKDGMLASFIEMIADTNNIG